MLTKYLPARWITGVALAACALSAQAQSGYSADLLGTFGRLNSLGRDISNNGHVVGVAFDGNWLTDPNVFLTNQHQFATYQGTSQVISQVAGLDFLATGINNSGQVVGYNYTLSDSGLGFLQPNPSRGFVISGGVPTDLGANRPRVSGISDSGLVVGSMRQPGQSSRPFLYFNGVANDLGVPAGSLSGSAVDVNESGVVLASLSGAVQQAGVYANGAWQVLPMIGPADVVLPRDLNDHGDAVAYYGADIDITTIKGVLYRNGVAIDLGGLDGKANTLPMAINNAGTIVGISYNDEVLNVPVIYRNGRWVDLNTMLAPADAARMTIVDVADINDSGQILGTAQIGDHFQAVVLTPVPEPATALLWLAGIAGLAWRRLR